MPQPTYTGEQIAVAARELRDAAGADDAHTTPPTGPDLTLDESLKALAPEIVLLRERGFSDDRIADLLTGFDIEVTGDQLGSFAGSITPRN